MVLKKVQPTPSLTQCCLQMRTLGLPVRLPLQGTPLFKRPHQYAELPENPPNLLRTPKGYQNALLNCCFSILLLPSGSCSLQLLLSGRLQGSRQNPQPIHKEPFSVKKPLLLVILMKWILQFFLRPQKRTRMKWKSLKCLMKSVEERESALVVV